MALRMGDVRVGAVAYFDDKALLAESEIKRNDDGMNRPGPFVCIQVVGNESVWSGITGVARPERLLIDARWRKAGSDAWRMTPQYLTDGINTHVGPTAAFIRAGSKETPFTRFRRPWVSPDGVQAIIVEVTAQGGTMLVTPPANVVAS